MTVKYHISKIDGIAKRCIAKTPESCRAERPEGLDDHYSTKEEASAAYEVSMSNVSSSPLKKPLNLQKVVDVEMQQFDEKKYIETSTEFLNLLSDEEKEALTGYVQSDYQDINEALYNGEELNAKFKKQAELMDSALAKYSGKKPKTVWRNFGGGKLNKEFHERGYKVGDTVDFDGYSSTAETSSGLMAMLNNLSWYVNEVPDDQWEKKEKGFGIKVSEEYGENGDKGRNTVLCIRPKNAAPVSMLRGRAAEQEWLIPRGKKFKVSEIYEDRELTGGYMKSGTYAHVYVLDEI